MKETQEEGVHIQQIQLPSSEFPEGDLSPGMSREGSPSKQIVTINVRTLVEEYQPEHLEFDYASLRESPLF